MRVIVAGSRTIPHSHEGLMRVWAAVERSGFEITEVVEGVADGADTLGFVWGCLAGVPISSWPAYWQIHGNKAGPIRNAQMNFYLLKDLERGKPVGVIVVWDGQSRGSANMLEMAMTTHGLFPDCQVFEDRAGRYFRNGQPAFRPAIV